MSSTVIDRENALKILRDSNPFQEFCKIWDAQKNQTERCQKDLILENEQEEVFIPKKNSKWANYKVKLCDEFKQNSECSKGDLCFYAHSIEEMRFKDSPILIRVKNMHEHSKLIKTAKPFIITNTQKYTLDSSNNDYVNSKSIHFNCILENSKLQEDLKQLKNHNEILNNQNLNLNNIIKDLKTEIEWYENEIQTKKILSLESQVKEQTDQIKKLNDEVDHKRLQIISLLHKNSELTEKISKEEQQISNGKANKSKAKKDLKDLNKKIEVLSKTNKELKTSYNNQTMISNLYLEDCKALQNEVQHYIKEIKALKDLMDKDQAKETNCKDIVIINQNDNFSYKSNYCDLISQLKDLFECPLSLDRLKNPIILPSGFTIEEEYFDRLVDSKDPYNKEFIVKHKTQNRFARQVKEIVEVSEDEMLKQQQSYQEIKAQLEIDRENCCKSVQTDFVVRAEEDIITIKQLTKLIEDYKLDGHRNQQIIEKLEEELICIEQEKATAIELLNVEQTKSKTKDLSNKSIIIKEDKSLMCDLSCHSVEDSNIDFMYDDQSEYCEESSETIISSPAQKSESEPKFCLNSICFKDLPKLGHLNRLKKSVLSPFLMQSKQILF